ncbi:hypothetical protein [Vibrio atypicus]|uniref:hypothetical protein n=1 Tax=Vibrio atypicus TaxID=558271 RepID=UPI003736842D
MISYLLILASVAIYILWRFSAAVKAKDSAAAKLDSYLEGSHAESSKLFAYFMYEECLDPFLLVKFLKFALFSRHAMDSKRVAEVKNEAERDVHEFTEMPKESKAEFVDVIMSILLVNIKLAPITYAALFLFIAVISLPSLLLGGVSSVRKLFEKAIFSIEDAFVLKKMS